MTTAIGSAREALSRSSTPDLSCYAGITNMVWLTADVHYAAAHYYDPGKAKFKDFLPFWEFVAGPLHSGTYGPQQLDMTFGPQVKFMKAAPGGAEQNLPPSAGMQFSG